MLGVFAGNCRVEKDIKEWEEDSDGRVYIMLNPSAYNGRGREFNSTRS